MLWLALALPDLPLAVFDRACEHPAPFAVTDQQRILAANPPAAAAGVRPGMKPGAAQALAPGLRLQPRDPDAEARALRQLAAWSLQFTPLVSLQPPLGLLLEIGGSLNLFGGLEGLLRQLRDGLAGLGYAGRLALAPTPSGAWLLNQGGDARPVLDTGTLPARLAPLPFTVLELDDRQAQALQGLGLSSLGDCLALPRAGLARRLGPGLLEQLDRALGRAPDPRRPYLPRPRFSSRLELPAEVESTEQLLFPLQRLLRELTGFLKGLDSGVQRLTLRLEHARGEETGVEVGLAAPSRELEKLLALSRERLERVELVAPVRGLALRADQPQLLVPERPDLLGDSGRPRHLWTTLVERLYARLGDQAICGLTTRAEHRPERAWDYVRPGLTAKVEAQPERPLWLLPQPQPLRQRQAQPLWHGALILTQGPERIETGWWDGQDVSRDYYVAHNHQGAKLWIFRERRGDRRWFLHGIFG